MSYIALKLCSVNHELQLKILINDVIYRAIPMEL